MPIKVICGEKCGEPDDVEVTYERLIRTSDSNLAVLVQFEDEQLWLPFSRLVEHDAAEKTLRMTRWLGDEKGLSEED